LGIGKKYVILFIFGILIIGITSQDAHAVTTWEFSGQIVRVVDDSGALGGFVLENDVFTGSFTFDENGADLEPEFENSGVYPYSEFIIEIGGKVILKSQEPFDFDFSHILVQHEPGIDAFVVHGQFMSMTAGPTELDDIDWHTTSFRLDELSGTIFPDDSLPQAPPSLDLFDNKQIFVQFGDLDGGFIDGNVTCLGQLDECEPCPENGESQATHKVEAADGPPSPIVTSPENGATLNDNRSLKFSGTAESGLIVNVSVFMDDFMDCLRKEITVVNGLWSIEFPLSTSSILYVFYYSTN